VRNVILMEHMSLDGHLAASAGSKADLHLADVKALDSGVVALHYKKLGHMPGTFDAFRSSRHRSGCRGRVEFREFAPRGVAVDLSVARSTKQ